MIHLTTFALGVRAIWILGYIDTPGLFSLRGVHAFLDIRGKVIKCLLDVDVVLGRNFEERDLELIGKFLALLGSDGSFLFPVTLVPDQDLVNAFAGMLLHV